MKRLSLALSLMLLAACSNNYKFNRIENQKLSQPPVVTTTTTTSTTTSTTVITTTTSTTTSSSTTTTTTSTTTTTTTSTTTTSTTTTTLVSQSDSINYPYSPTRDLFRQEVYDANHTTASFKAFNSNGENISNISKSDIVVLENGLEVQNYKLRENSSQDKYDVDIVFTIDSTGSMKGTINSVKAAIRDFVGKLSQHNVHASLCMVTFKDLVEKVCSRFVEDDPSTAQNENLESFLDELARLKASGGGSPNENSMGGLVAAARKTPWHSNTQRVVVLFTDIEFWIKPIHNHEPEARTAPTYPEVMDAITDTKITVFPITKKTPGFASDYFKYPSVTRLSNGQYFELKKIEQGKITMDEIFEKIGHSIISNYVVDYNVEDNPGLDPTLPLSQRKIEILPRISGTQITLTGVSTNMPNGRPEYKTRFLLQAVDINANTLHVFINSNEVFSGFRVENKDLVFDVPPAPGSEILAIYERKKLRDNVKVTPLILTGQGQLYKLKVYYNGAVTKPDDYVLGKTLDGRHVFEPTDNAFVDSDPYRIRNFGSLDVKLEYQSEK